MCKIINFGGLEKSPNDKEKKKRPETEHQVLSFAEMNDSIDDARILHAKISRFAKTLIDEGFDNSLVYQQLFKTADSMSCLYTESHADFIRSVHDSVAEFHPELCDDFRPIDSDT